MTAHIRGFQLKAILIKQPKDFLDFLKKKVSYLLCQFIFFFFWAGGSWSDFKIVMYSAGFKECLN